MAKYIKDPLSAITIVSHVIDLISKLSSICHHQQRVRSQSPFIDLEMT